MPCVAPTKSIPSCLAVASADPCQGRRGGYLSSSCRLRNIREHVLRTPYVHGEPPENHTIPEEGVVCVITVRPARLGRPERARQRSSQGGQYRRSCTDELEHAYPVGPSWKRHRHHPPEATWITPTEFRYTRTEYGVIAVSSRTEQATDD